MLSPLVADCNGRTPGPVMRTSRPANAPNDVDRTHAAAAPGGCFALFVRALRRCQATRTHAAAAAGGCFALFVSAALRRCQATRPHRRSGAWWLFRPVR